MRVVSWNILDGGINADGDTSRRSMILDVLHSLNADVVVLQEANGFDKNDAAVLREFANTLGMNPVLAQADSGFHVATFTRIGVRTYVSARPQLSMQHTASVVKVHARPQKSNGNYEPLSIVGAHFAPFSGAQRQNEAKQIAGLKNAPSTLIVLDANTLDDAADQSAMLSAMPVDKRVRYLDAAGNVDSRPLAIFKESGLVDVFDAVCNGSPPNTAPTRLTAKLDRDDFSPVQTRLDYGFATPDVAAACVSASVLKNDATEHASDHYPLIFDFSLELQQGITRTQQSELA